MIRLFGIKTERNESKETASRLDSFAALRTWGCTELPHIERGEKGKPFFMEIEDIFSPQKGCKVVVGKIKGGIMSVNDTVEIIGNGCSVNTEVTGIELYDKKVNSKGLFNEAHPGDWAGCLLKNTRNLTKVKEGCVLKKQSL